MAGLELYKPPLKSPLTVSIWITDKCNISCKYCYANPISNNMMDIERLYQLIDELYELEIFDITIAGGEPFLHPDIYKIMKRILEHDMQLGVLTNGILLNEKSISYLAEITQGKKFILQVSLDSADSQVNDLTRGMGETVINNLNLLAKTDIKLQLSCVINGYNIDTAHQIIDTFYPKIKRFHFLNIQRTERSLKHPELLISEEEAQNFWFHLRDYAKNFPDDLFLPSLRIMLRTYGEDDSDKDRTLHKKAAFKCQSCSAGITKVEIDSQFNVLGCDIAKDFSFMGNISKASFSSVWNSYQAYQVRNSPYPLCYKIKGPDGKALQDNLKSTYRYV